MAKVRTIQDVIEEYRTEPSAVVRGTRFEELMADYFSKDATLAATYDEVWRWPEWPHNEGTHDTGIDLVARERESGRWAAIQCKFYDPRHRLQKADIDSFFTASGRSWDGVVFDNRIIISTTDRWSRNAEEALRHQSVPVQRIGMADIAESRVDWMFHSDDPLGFTARKAVRFGMRPHQKEAIDAIQAGFASHDRGQWISACGTGKTFTSLKLAERRCAENEGHLKVLFLAPSISLVSQSLREWLAQSQTPIRPLVVCSDTKASRQAEDITVHDIPLPTTDPDRLVAEMAAGGRRGRQMTVIFSTYQSIDVVARAQKQSGAAPFDLILCDEAHRTTGVTLAGDTSESAFIKVHDNAYLPAVKRLYMTATPRIYGTDVKKKADDAAAVLTSMDDEATFGPVFHRLGFGQAVERGLLSDYKVMILAVANDAIDPDMQASLAGEGHEISLDDAAKIVGCWNGLAKRTTDHDFGDHPTPMQRAVAFAANIKASKAFVGALPQVVDQAISDDAVLQVDAHHVDGTMNALARGEELAWLKAPVPEGECRILSNARCLAEGVDVPALDAVLFLSPRNSLVDVVQSVGRVMRKAPGKDYGYVILPVAIDASEEPEVALRDNKRFRVVWDVLNALRAHDDRFEAMINTIDLDHSTGGRVSIDVFTSHDDRHDDDTRSGADGQTPVNPYAGSQSLLVGSDLWRNSILGRIVKKCGQREYWESWAGDVVDIHATQVRRITGIIAAARRDGAPVAGQFDVFLDGLRDNLNDSIDAAQAVDMISQHLITRPVFDALFPAGSFAERNPVSITMGRMAAALAGYGLSAETAQLDRFYDSVRRRAAQIRTPEGRQSVIHQLYEQFFRKAFPAQASSLGVVYTPVPIVDFILRAADQVCRDQFGYGITDAGVHVQDPFTGTGTFIVRLLQSGIIAPADLARKYTGELWANEYMLLAYYIAAVNIETTYQALVGEQQPDHPVDYVPFPGATLTDTFQITEDGDRSDTSLIPVNNQRIEAQLAAPIKVIIGNPPYSAGQTSANDNNANLSYPTLDGRIAATYAAQSTATNKNNLYDSYIRAFRWATDRLGDQGVVAFVTNNGWLDGNTADGIRTTFQTEFSDIWVYNLRGNQRTAGERSRQEGGKVFGPGSRTGVAVLVAAKNPHQTGCQIHYHGVPDYQSREDKLDDITDATLDTTTWTTITPNDDGDWLNQRNPTFQTFTPIADEPLAIFASHSAGVQTNRDAWCYNFSRKAVEANMSRMIDYYNQQASNSASEEQNLDRDPTKISWSSSLVPRALRGELREFRKDSIRTSIYRPFTKQAAYFDPVFNHRPGKNAAYFPTPAHDNIGFYIVGPGSDKPFALIATSCLPDLAMWGSSNGQFFPRWTYERAESGDQSALPASDEAVDKYGYRRVDNITDQALKAYRDAFGLQVSKDDIFFYVYAVLHSQQYRATFAADLKRMLPRIPLASSRHDFDAFVEAGRKLADLHIGYETVEPYPLTEHLSDTTTGPELYRVQKMRWKDKTTKKSLIYNQHLTLDDIPAATNEYMLGSRSALEWIIDRYQVKTDKASGIINDPNQWATEHHDPRYVIDLIKRITRVSVDTVVIAERLAELPLEGGR
ncbi:damage-inducible protein [Acidipropionibacterium jensenii]|uniref:DEAD/DEAH box helicase n=1 Tax=Acidipropionibacterium jensenii TaxID=1749 RepID=UPI00110AE958|nr:type ISP restriction/modification enzyme [Acidipropionibacterium jensenii]QCV87985.1 damage-inducible protein [Acidipropionibacterium jensenii]